MLEKLFKISERGSDVKTEIIAGLTAFMTMVYILAANPYILGKAGMDTGSVFVATALSAAISTAIVGLFANLPFMLTPGMGLNAFFAFSVVIGMGYTWQFALTAVFLEGLIFILITITNLREALVHCISPSLRKAISAGIGLFIAFIGLKNAGIVVADENTLVALGNFDSNGSFVAVFGLFVTVVLLVFKSRGALFFGILLATFIGIPLEVTNFDLNVLSKILTIPSIEPTFLQFEWHNIFTLDMLIVLITFLFVDIFDTLGTVLALGTKAKLIDENGNMPKIKSAFMADAIGTTIGAVLGTSTVVTTVESASGIAEGGKTGLTAMTIACLFLISILFAPLFLIIPAQAVAPALIVVGFYMVSPITEIDYSDYVSAFPAFLTIIIMPLTYSIAYGIMFGLIAHVILATFANRHNELNALSYILMVVFIWKLAVG